MITSRDNLLQMKKSMRFNRTLIHKGSKSVTAPVYAPPAAVGGVLATTWQAGLEPGTN